MIRGEARDGPIAGRLSGNWPMSPTVRTSRPVKITSALSTTIATNGDGTALVSSGKP